MWDVCPAPATLICFVNLSDLDAWSPSSASNYHRGYRCWRASRLLERIKILSRLKWAAWSITATLLCFVNLSDLDAGSLCSASNYYGRYRCRRANRHDNSVNHLVDWSERLCQPRPPCFGLSICHTWTPGAHLLCPIFIAEFGAGEQAGTDNGVKY